MCKFLIPKSKNSSSNEKLKSTAVLEQENKKLEESLLNKITQQKNFPLKAESAKISSKLEDLFHKLKKLDEINFKLEEENKAKEMIIRKQKKIINQLKEKNQNLNEEKNNFKQRVRQLEHLLLPRTNENCRLRDVLQDPISFFENDELDITTVTESSRKTTSSSKY